MKLWQRFGFCLIVGAAIWFSPTPSGVEPEGWRVLAVFVATIVSFLLRPLPMGAMTLIALVFLAATNTLSFKQTLAGFSDTTVWLVVAAFLIAGTVARTGLGRRVALIMVTKLGRTTLGLGYAATITEFILGALVPSNTARGGGVMAPVMNSLSNALGSTPGKSPRRAGEYLMLVGAHANLIAAASFLTGMAANPLVSAAAKTAFDVEFEWLTWLTGSIVPALVSVALLPLFIYKLRPPQIKQGREAVQNARGELKEMGPLSRDEKIMAGVFVSMLVLWASKPLHGLATGVVALIGVCVLLITHADTWKNATGLAPAWDTLVWLGGLLAMANMLKEFGVVDWFASEMQTYVSGMSGFWVAIILALIYFYSMYGFTMLTGHIAAMAGAFFAVALAAGTPPLLMVALIAYFSNLCGCTTNYSTGPFCIYYGLGYVEIGTWYRVGFLVSLLHISVWLGVGLVWWKILGWW